MRLPWSKKEAEAKDRIISCPRCNAPAPADKPFCDACGARLAPPPSCPLCATLLEPGSRFCPSCGTMIGSGKEKAHSGKKAEKIPTAPEKTRAAGQGSGSGTGKTDGQGEPAPTGLAPKKSCETIPPGTGRWGLSGGSTPAVIAIVVILLVMGAILIGSGILTIPCQNFVQTAAVTEVTPATTTTIPVNASTAAAGETTAQAIVMVPGPTQTLPAHLNIVLQEERDPRTRVVSVEYMGGKGQSAVREIAVRLTRSDGEVLTGSFKPIQVGSRLELQGTEQADRVEVTVRYYSGKEYTVIDRVFEYKVRTA